MRTTPTSYERRSMRTTDVANAYNLRRKHFSSEYTVTDRRTRGIITRSILNTDLSAHTYELIAKFDKQFTDMELQSPPEMQKKLAEINEWISNFGENTKYISDIKSPSRLHGLMAKLESIKPLEITPKELFEQFYKTYMGVIHTIIEDALIRIYVVEDTKSLIVETHSMLNNISSLNPIGGLRTIIDTLINIFYESLDTEEQNPHVQFIDTYAHSTFVWSQSAQVILDFTDSILTGESVSLENVNQVLQHRMKQIVESYKTF